MTACAPALIIAGINAIGAGGVLTLVLPLGFLVVALGVWWALLRRGRERRPGD